MRRLFVVAAVLAVLGAPAALAYQAKTNFASGTLAAAVGNADTVLSITPRVYSAAFPQAGVFTAVIYASTCTSPTRCPQRELVTLEYSVGTTYTVVGRAQEGTTTPAAGWPAGANVDGVLTAGQLVEIQNSIGGGGGGAMVYPQAGLAISTGIGWDFSLVESDGYLVIGSAGKWTKTNAPAISAANMYGFPTFNQSTTGTAAGLGAAYIDWNAPAGGQSILNKPALGSAAAKDISFFQAALGFTPENIASKSTDTTLGGGSPSTTAYPSQSAVAGALAGKAATNQAVDLFGAPTDTTAGNASTSAHGFMQKCSGGTTNFFRADCTWAAPAGGGTISNPTDTSHTQFYGWVASSQTQTYFDSFDYAFGTTNHLGLPLFSTVSTTIGDTAYNSTSHQLLISYGSGTDMFAPTGTLTNGKWCSTDGTTVSCTQNAPTSAPSGTGFVADHNGAFLLGTYADIVGAFGSGSCSGYLKSDGTCATPGGSGTVTSVTLVMPGDYTVTGSPVTSAGTFTVTRSSQTANYFLASPSGSSGAPTYRAIVAADIPTLNQSTTGSAATLTTPRAIYGNNFDGSAALTSAISPTYGGTGANTSTWTGVNVVSSGTYTTKANPSGAFVGTTDTQTLTNKTQTGMLETVTDLGNCGSSSVTPANSSGTMFIVTINSATACTINNPSSLVAGMSFTVKVVHTSTGTLSFGTNYKWPSGTAPTWSTSGYDIFACASFSGTALQCNGIVDVR